MADLEYVAFGPDESNIINKETYLQQLHQEILKDDILIHNFVNMPVFYFYEYDKKINQANVGRIGPNKDKSNRNYPFIFSRTVLDENIKQYPLLIPSLYNEFYNISDSLLHDNIKQLSLDEFKVKVNKMNRCSVYKDQREVLKAAMSNMFDSSVEKLCC